MLIKACANITKISDNEVLNTQNYMEGIEYITNLYEFLNVLKRVVPVNKVLFLPSFKGKFIVEKMGIAATSKENEMKVFKIKSTLFLEDEISKNLRKEMTGYCQEIYQENDILTFILP